jgi:hypothetical protein
MRASHATENCLSEILQIFCLLHAARDEPCAIRAPHTRASRSQGLRRHVPFMYSRASRSFSRFALEPDGCAVPIARCARVARATRTPTPITYADCHNECLYQYGSRSVLPFGRQRWICSLSVYARLCTHTRARTWAQARAHTHTHTHTRTHIHTHTVLSR